MSNYKVRIKYLQPPPNCLRNAPENDNYDFEFIIKHNFGNETADDIYEELKNVDGFGTFEIISFELMTN